MRRAARDVARLGAGGARRRSCGATGAATAATSCTSGSRCCSSASRRRRRSRRSTWSSCGPGRPTRVGGYAITYERPTSRLDRGEQRPARADRPRRAAARPRGDGARRVLDTYKSYFPSTASDLGPVSRFFEGEATSEVGAARRPPRATSGPPSRPTSAGCGRGSRRATSVFADARPSCRRADRGAFLAEALRGLTAPTPTTPPPATFRFIVSPLVTWIWLGALIVFVGAAIALLAAPAPGRAAPRDRRAASRASRASSTRVPEPWRSSLVADPRRRSPCWRSARRCAPRRVEREAARPAERADLEARARREVRARSATPRWTTAPASCPRPTGARSTASCAREAVELLHAAGRARRSLP